MITGRIVAAELQQIEMADHVGAHICMRIEQRIAHAGLSTEVRNTADFVRFQRFGQSAEIGEIHAVETEPVLKSRGELPKTIFLQLNGIIVVEVVNADDLFSPSQEPRCDVKSDEACGPSYQCC